MKWPVAFWQQAIFFSARSWFRSCSDSACSAASGCFADSACYS